MCINYLSFILFFLIINIIRAVLYCGYGYMKFNLDFFVGYFKGLTRVRYDFVWVFVYNYCYIY